MPSATMPSFNLAEQFTYLDAQSGGYRLDTFNGRIAVATFHIRNVGPVEIGTGRKFFLRNAKGMPLLSDRAAEGNVNTFWSILSHVRPWSRLVANSSTYNE